MEDSDYDKLETALTKKAVDWAEQGDHEKPLELLRAAISSVEESVRIAPNSVYFARLLGQLRAETARHVNEYQTTVDICKKALQISQPTDPYVDDPDDGRHLGIQALWRIEYAQKHIQRCIDECNLAIQERIRAYWASLGAEEQQSHLQVRIPSKVDKRWCEVINHGRWEPVNRDQVPEQEKKWEHLGNDERSKETARGGPVLIEWDPCKDPSREKKLHAIHYMLDRNHLCICLLDDVDLDEIVKFLEGLIQFPTENLSNLVDETFYNRTVPLIKEKIYCDGNLLRLVLDGGDKPASSIELDEEDQGVPDLSDLLKWCFADPSMEDEVESWFQKQDKFIQETSKLLQTHHTNFQNLQNMCREKQDQLNHMQALRTNSGPGESNSTISAEVSLIAGFLQQCDEDSLARNLPGFRDSELLPALDEHPQNSLQQGDMYRNEAINRISKYKHLKLMEKDAMIMQKWEQNTIVEGQITSLSAYDYRGLLSPILKAYIKAQLQEAAVRYLE